MAINAGPARSATPSARWLQMAGRRRRAVLYGIALAALGAQLRDRRTQQHAIMIAIGVAAAAGLARESQTRSLGRLLAWEERQYQRYLRTREKNEA